MFTIDLLKGHGIPIKSRRGGTLLVIATFAVPLLVAVGLYAQYMFNSITLQTLKNSLADCEKKIAACEHSVKIRADLEKQLGTMNSARSDVATVVRKNEQWSGIVKSVVDLMPRSMLLRKLDVKVTKSSKSEPDPVDPNKVRNNNYVTRTMQLCLIGNSHVDCVPMVKSYIKLLGESSALKSRIDDIRITAQAVEKVGTAEMMQFDIACVFKSQAE